jgi:tetratricopeptide (TPR) repeat protein
MGEYAKAEPLYQQALRIRQKVLGPEHPDTAGSLNNLALLYKDMGEYTKAEPLLQEALRINEKNFGGGHPRTVLYLDNLGYVKFQLGRIEEAKDLAHLKAKAELALVSKVFSFTTEQQRLAYSNEFDPYDLFVLLNRSEIDLAASVLRYKGAVLDSVIEDRLVAEASRDLDDRKLIEQLQSTRQQLGGCFCRPRTRNRQKRTTGSRNWKSKQKTQKRN